MVDWIDGTALYLNELPREFACWNFALGGGQEGYVLPCDIFTLFNAGRPGTEQTLPDAEASVAALPSPFERVARTAVAEARSAFLEGRVPEAMELLVTAYARLAGLRCNDAPRTPRAWLCLEYQDLGPVHWWIEFQNSGAAGQARCLRAETTPGRGLFCSTVDIQREGGRYPGPTEDDPVAVGVARVPICCLLAAHMRWLRMLGSHAWVINGDFGLS